MAAASATSKSDSKICTCPACPPRKRFLGHKQPCSRARQSGVRFGTYCKGCAMHYLCRRCNHNAVPGNIPNQICEDCELKRCRCPGTSSFLLFRFTFDDSISYLLIQFSLANSMLHLLTRSGSPGYHRAPRSQKKKGPLPIPSYTMMLYLRL